MKTSIVIFAGAFLAFAGGSGSAAVANKMDCANPTCCRPAQEKAPATADPAAEERFRMKFGRSTPAEEARQKAAQEEYTKNMRDCAEHGCRMAHEKTVTVAATPATADPGAEERFRMKFGRSTPAEEARLKTAREVYAKNMRNCADHGCGSMAHEKTVTAAATRATADPGAEDRFRMKFGRNTPAEERRQTATATHPEKTRMGSADRSMCGPDCCKHAR